MSQFRMPSLGADMESGTLVEWLKKPGEPVRRGDIVAVVETEKGAIEVEIFTEGIMGTPLVALGTKVPVGTPLAMIEEAATAAPPAAPAIVTPVPVSAAPAPVSVPPALEPPAAIAERAIRASPAARKAAGERGLDLSRLKGTGPGGAIALRDVEGAAEKAPSARPGLDLNKMRVAIAAAMAHSKREIPHYYLATDIDMTRATAWLEEANASRTPENRLLPAALLFKAVALAVRKYPAFNGAYSTSSGFAPSEHVHLGTAIAIRGGGLVAPALHDCDRLDLDRLMANLRDLVARARVGRLRSSEISDPTITVSNLGERGAESLFGVIYPPQVAIVGFGKVVRKPVAIGDEVQIRPMMSATLAADHRVSDGHAGSLFLNEIALLLNEPERL
jgi:pyruvate dehydrogenase E2 component (dihydrolipoamide acetyltransferase)